MKMLLLTAATWLVATPSVWCQSLYLRADPAAFPYTDDFRARRVGDVLTIVISEITEFGAQEKREMNKETRTGAMFNMSGKSATPGVSRSFSADIDGQSSSNRKFDGKANSSIDRKFVDRMGAIVVDVLPNGNLVVEGWRQRAIGRETRLLRVTGIVRPGDIDGLNTVHSQYIANFQVAYQGRGPETNFTNQGWGGRLFNIIWPH
jgi:flagellar L-ring protein precursor FlgH